MVTITKAVYESDTIKNEKTTIITNKYVDENNVSYYDQLVPKNEPKFMKYIRRLEKRAGFVTPLKWFNVIAITAFHTLVPLAAIYLFIYKKQSPKWGTLIVNSIVGIMAGLGVTAGAHRYWTHKAYKATLPLKLILLYGYTVAFQNSLPDWVIDHRVHHKFSETSADPHDSNRGLFFSHVGWLYMYKHPHVIREGKKIDMSDIHSDPLVRFHTKYFRYFSWGLAVVLPTLVPVLFWGERLDIALVTCLCRILYSLNCTWSVNSFAHEYGYKPFNVDIKPSQNWIVSYFAMGEGWHNYHHTFPWDYKTAELGQYLNFTTSVIDFFAKIGWAYDLKTASENVVETVRSKQEEKLKSR